MAPPEPPSPRMIGDVRHAEAQTDVGRARDGLRLATLLGADARVGAGGVHQRQDRNAEAVGHFHQADSLAVALRPRHAEIVLEPAFGRRALLVPDDAQALPAETAETADDRLVVAEFPVAGERHEIGDQRGDVVEAMRPLRMPCHLGFLPGGELGVEFVERLRGLGLEA